MGICIIIIGVVLYLVLMRLSYMIGKAHGSREDFKKFISEIKAVKQAEELRDDLEMYLSEFRLMVHEELFVISNTDTPDLTVIKRRLTKLDKTIEERLCRIYFRRCKLDGNDA